MSNPTDAAAVTTDGNNTLLDELAALPDSTVQLAVNGCYNLENGHEPFPGAASFLMKDAVRHVREATNTSGSLDSPIGLFSGLLLLGRANNFVKGIEHLGFDQYASTMRRACASCSLAQRTEAVRLEKLPSSSGSACARGTSGTRPGAPGRRARSRPGRRCRGPPRGSRSAR